MNPGPKARIAEAATSLFEEDPEVMAELEDADFVTQRDGCLQEVSP